jgi:hypothetical protein
MKFYFDIFIMAALSLFLFFLPGVMWVIHGTPRNERVGDLGTIVGVIGGFAVSALVSLNRRLKALEKPSSSGKETV